MKEIKGKAPVVKFPAFVTNLVRMVNAQAECTHELTQLRYIRVAGHKTLKCECGRVWK